ncbi:hypothetical protein AB0284_20415 [Pseudarthrobacter phenanthrenivorans]|uniref:hypothetical protein n=1 Tax=Pseudarthrobacter phenanthrenivorans TaxID=361575 RepID=UPI00344B8C8A
MQPERFTPAAAGHLAMAGVRVGKTPTSPSMTQDEACVLLDEGQIQLAVETLNAAGADVTVWLDSQP